MAATQEQYQHLILLFAELCKTKVGDLGTLQSVRDKIVLVVEVIEKYHLFGAGLSNDFVAKLKDTPDEFTPHRALLAKQMYLNLVNLLVYFEITPLKAAECSHAIEKAALHLPFNEIQVWHQQESPLDLIFREFSSFFSSNIVDAIMDENKYNQYKTHIISKGWSIRFQDEKKIPISKLKKIESYFGQEVAAYRDYVEVHFQEIKEQFSSYESRICFYIIPQKKVGQDSLLQVSQYKDQKSKSISIYPHYVDIAPRYGNLETFPTLPLVVYTGLFDENAPAKYASQFTVQSIYFDLHRLFMRKATNEQHIDYLVYFLKGRGYNVGKDKDPTLIFLNMSGKKYNCRLLFNDIPNIEQLEHIVSEEKGFINAIALKMVADRETFDFLLSSKIKFYVLDLLGKDQINARNEEMLYGFIKPRIKTIASDSSVYAKGNALLVRLQKCPKGLEGWAEYETICCDIFEFLFKDNFRYYTARTQTYTHDKIFRRDLIINNNYKDSTSIWAHAKADFNCNVIVIDFKNYHDPLEQNEFYLPSKYLNLIGGKFGILFTRAGLGESAKDLQKKLLQTHGELLLCLSDKDLEGMIDEKMSAQDPIYRLENQKFNLYQLF